MIIGPYDVPADAKGRRQKALLHTVKSMGLGAFPSTVYWRFEGTRVAIPSALVVPRLAVPLEEHFAQRREQLVVVTVTPAASALVEVVNIATGQSAHVGVFDPAGIADAVAGLCGAVAVAFQYQATSWFEGLAMALAERRLRST
ncbi:MAG TPA: hypothetical protein VL049_07935 [Candidatus Dormibacteraeota bacterium]|nr:hypothetical protein [Candidatus Dormibacteraeota bacterium]